MPIIQVTEKDKTIYRGVKALEEFSEKFAWEEHGVAEHESMYVVHRRLLIDHLHRTEKLARQCALLLVCVQNLTDGSDTGRAVEELAQDVLCEAGRLAEYHPESGMNLVVMYDKASHQWIGLVDQKPLEESLMDWRLGKLRDADRVEREANEKTEKPTKTRARRVARATRKAKRRAA